jgi:hypothetical protein
MASPVVVSRAEATVFLETLTPRRPKNGGDLRSWAVTDRPSPAVTGI